MAAAESVMYMPSRGLASITEIMPVRQPANAAQTAQVLYDFFIPFSFFAP